MERYKYPSTPHFEWSPTVTHDDRILHDLSQFDGKSVVMTEKLDGENTTLYNDYWHPRSLSRAPHKSRSWVGSLWGRIRLDIPNGMRICGENVYAKHSIYYPDVEPPYFYVFNIWQDDLCLSWDDTVEWCQLLGLKHSPVIASFQWDKEIAHGFYTGKSAFGDVAEGYVVRIKEAFKKDEFWRSVAKWVRPNHVQTTKHWMFSQLEFNG